MLQDCKRQVQVLYDSGWPQLLLHHAQQQACYACRFSWVLLWRFHFIATAATRTLAATL